MTIHQLDTPALVVDLDIMERNLCRVADYARSHGLRLRPHTKTHKTPALARRQLDLGAAGLTVAKVGEAEVMLQAEPEDILVAYPVLGPAKLARLMAVAQQARVTVALDSLDAARQLSDAASAASLEIGVLVEFDAGLGRMGVVPGEDLIDLARQVRSLPSLRFEGIACYAGHVKRMDDEGQEKFAHFSRLLESVCAAFERAHIDLPVVSAGSTPTLFHSHLAPSLNEIRPGTYIFNDRNTVESGACAAEDCAATMIVTVVSNARQGRVMIDGGSKTFSSDRPTAASDVTFGWLVGEPAVRFFQMNEEHGYLDTSLSGRSFAVGERLRIIPNHVCVAMNLHETVYGIRGETVECSWTVAARGKLQ
ncbi:MAG: alanine racemase [Bryobacteraceae bacterium]|nr:alanine racemase [Bryobacteraceae bacterium]